MDERRFDILAAAYVRGCALETGAPELPARLADAPLEELDGDTAFALYRLNHDSDCILSTCILKCF